VLHTIGSVKTHPYNSLITSFHEKLPENGMANFTYLSVSRTEQDLNCKQTKVVSAYLLSHFSFGLQCFRDVASFDSYCAPCKLLILTSNTSLQHKVEVHAYKLIHY